jgi:hypothetical protein
MILLHFIFCDGMFIGFLTRAGIPTTYILWHNLRGCCKPCRYSRIFCILRQNALRFCNPCKYSRIFCILWRNVRMFCNPCRYSRIFCILWRNDRRLCNPRILYSVTECRACCNPCSVLYIL